MTRGNARILLVDDDDSIRRIMGNELRQMGFTVSTSEDLGAAGQWLSKHECEIVIIDIRLPGGDGRSLLKQLAGQDSPPTVIMLTGHGDIDMAVECMREGAYDFLTKPCSLNEIEMSIRRALEHHSLLQINRTLAYGHTSVRVGEKLLGNSQAMSSLRELIARLAPTDETILISGESGTGKELVAQAIWRASARCNGPFIAINCAAVAESLLESELFGHEKGAFSGAERCRAGMFELANKGTLLFDEIGEMPPAMQSKLLRVLQSGEVRRVGGAETFLVDVRVIACTNRVLADEVRDGNFREDLFHRVNTLEICVPPLRERREDIPLLAGHFLEVLAHRPGGSRKSLSEEALECCMSHAWPGNVRELENTLRRASIMAEGTQIEIGDLPSSLVQPEGQGNAPAGEALSLAEVERRHILAMLQYNDGNKMKTARMLGITTKTLYNKLAAYGM